MDLEFKGARARIRRERELVWLGAMLPRMKEPVPLEKFIGRAVDARTRAREFHAAWDKVDLALRR